MAFKEDREPGSANDAAGSEHSPNDHHSNIIAAKAASVAAERTKKEAADRAAAEFKAEAAKNAQDLEVCRAEIITLKAQLGEAQQLANTSNAQGAQAKSTTETLQSNLTAKMNQLVAAKAEIETLTSNSSSLSNRMSALTASNEQLQLQLNRCATERDANAAERDRIASQHDYYSAELSRRVSELDNGDVTIRQITWGGRDLTNDGNVANKVKNRVRNGWGLPFSNDFFGCDPLQGSRKFPKVADLGDDDTEEDFIRLAEEEEAEDM
ncbi:hypothetical protein B0J13DRAFT_664377 [Dactylonectria estremocensis]|uniref:Uncharacterized protein n=1 Tax=Dactylonectria estremocensis TaxID=1079267 RepID=A0A9P9J6X0_9HYPO|nr:hypothetical protein B0J13DRAFT_664377 [Dactylonectria estremocensis]